MNARENAEVWIFFTGVLLGLVLGLGWPLPEAWPLVFIVLLVSILFWFLSSASAVLRSVAKESA